MWWIAIGLLAFALFWGISVVYQEWEAIKAAEEDLGEIVAISMRAQDELKKAQSKKLARKRKRTHRMVRRRFVRLKELPQGIAVNDWPAFGHRQEITKEEKEKYWSKF